MEIYFLHLCFDLILNFLENNENPKKTNEEVIQTVKEEKKVFIKVNL